jgi:hypothetical protein
VVELDMAAELVAEGLEVTENLIVPQHQVVIQLVQQQLVHLYLFQ